jgi:hypothetical protein
MSKVSQNKYIANPQDPSTVFKLIPQSSNFVILFSENIFVDKLVTFGNIKPLSNIVGREKN